MALSLDIEWCQGRISNLANNGMHLKECAYVLLRELILNHQLKSATPLVERELEILFGISRTPLRQAIEKLEGRGLVTRVSARITCVKVVTLQEYLQALSMRLILEVEASTLCFDRITKADINEVEKFIKQSELIENNTEKHWQLDDKVHTLISDHCGNVLMRETIERMRVICNLFEETHTNYALLPGWKEHVDIFEAIKAEDKELTTQLMKEHLILIKQRLLDGL